MIARWNEYIKDGDRVYHLGDVAMGPTVLARIMPRLNGSKRLVLGNHDVDPALLHRYFKKARLWRMFTDEGFVCTHIPLRLEQFRHKLVLNVHGHMHQNIVPDPHYFNVCVECHDYRPVHMDEVLVRVGLARASLEELASEELVSYDNPQSPCRV